jgi:Na+-translocating ferredoxin:NAD+ oxidoreductase RnfC subunit
MPNFNLHDSIREAGVVGAGGAGFPTHVKLRNVPVHTIIANGAECEPLIHKDKELMRHFASEILEGLRLAAEWLSAEKSIIGIKEKNKAEIDSLRRFADRTVGFCLMKDIYPAGDEFILVYEATGMLIPPGGIPLEIGCVVSNVETLHNVALAVQGVPVTLKFVTVAGAVKKPCTLKVSIGTSYADCITLAGGPATDNYAVLSGGAMMGELVTDMTTPITKTTAGLIVLPVEHQQVRRRLLPPKAVRRIGASCCDQCYRCTELCPRWLLGYEIVPHEVMRSLLFAPGEQDDFFSRYSMLCIECNICSLYACPEDLDPKSICTWSKRQLLRRGIRPEKNRPVKVHSMRNDRQVPTKLLTRRLGLETYDFEAQYLDSGFTPDRVRIPLKQHAGSAAVPVVRVGERVARGQLIGEIYGDNLGARVHASIDGTVEAIDRYVTIERN